MIAVIFRRLPRIFWRNEFDQAIFNIVQYTKELQEPEISGYGFHNHKHL